MDLLADLDARGLVHDTTDREALAARLAEGPITVYHGMDPSADSLHTGNLIGLIALRRFQLAGHRPIALAGGATGMVGDPSGRSGERNLLDEETLRANVEAIKAQIARVLGPIGDWELVDNYDWTSKLTLLDFLRDVGKHATVNQMIARESVKARMASEHGISYTEFSYMLLQAHDYWWLHQHRGCELQIGGSDQWGNILSGVDLIRRRDGVAVHALSWPLLEAPDGTKLGKTTGARIWLDPARTSPYQLFQHFLNTDDRQVRQMLLWFTLLPVEEIDALVAAHEVAPERREAQRVLAREVTGLVHGADEAARAESGGRDWDENRDPSVLAAREGTIDTTYLGSQPASLEVVPLLVQTGLAASRSAATRLIK
ncbi:MAG: tyrosyl-tRNA synthetase, partial [Acidimicrobiaceae bacterium]